MSASQYRSQIQRKQTQKNDANRKAGEYRTKESKKRAEADKARQAAAKTASQTTAKSKLAEAARRDKEAAAAGEEAARWQKKAAAYAKEETAIARRLARAETTEARAAQRKHAQDAKRAETRERVQRAEYESRISQTEATVEGVVRELRAPRPEKLRVLLLGASADGGLRVGREQSRIRNAVQSALHRDHIDIDPRPAATTADLLDGLMRFRPHVVHFSGHSNQTLIEFERDKDEPHEEGAIVTATAFARAIAASDEPPLLVLLNSCDSAAQIDDLVENVVPFAVGMADEIDDTDAINYAAQFYAAVANGQSVQAAHNFGQAALELAGLPGADLPTLAWANDVDPSTTILVTPSL